MVQLIYKQYQDELVVIMYCERDDAAGEIKSCARYYVVEVPKKAGADGLITCLVQGLKGLGVEDVLSKAIAYLEQKGNNYYGWDG